MSALAELNETNRQESQNFQVIYANDELIVVNKPYDVPMDGHDHEITVEQWANNYMEVNNVTVDVNTNITVVKQKRQLKFVHQLDYSTSGVLCLAFSKDMAARLAHCFQMRTCHKYYLAILQGHVPIFETWNNNNNDDDDKNNEDRECKEKTISRIRWKEFLDESHTQPISNEQSKEAHKSNSDDGTYDKEEGIWIIDSLSIAHAVDRGHIHITNSYRASRSCTEQTESHNERFYSPCANTYNDESKCNKESNMQMPSSSSSSSSEAAATNAESELETRFDRLVRENHRVIEINYPVGYDITDMTGFRMTVIDMVSDNTSSKSSITYLHVLERGIMYNPLTGEACPVTRVLLEPKSGRRHQLRVHCRALGYPILGDVTYTTAKELNQSNADNVTLNNSTTNKIISSACSIKCSSLHVFDKLRSVTCDSNKSKKLIELTETTQIGNTCPEYKSQAWERMYLHAWRLCMPCNVNASLSDRDKRAQKKKRRRETLQLESAMNNIAELNTWTEFIADNPLWEVKRYIK